MTRNRYQFGLTLLVGFFLLASLFAILLYAVTPATPATRGPLFLTIFIAVLLGTLVAILLFLRWLLRPYRQLVGEAERASPRSSPQKSLDEGEFVLETFQSVVAQLQEQRKALEHLTAQASKRADSAEKFSERIVASVPSGLVAFDGSGRSMVINGPGRSLLEVEGATVGQPVASILHNIPQLAEMVERCLQTGQIYRREEIETLTSEKLARRIGATVAPIDLAPGEGERGALCLLTDITEVTQLREQVALKNNLASLGEMSAGLAHEFKNAIATLHGYVQLLQSLELDEQALGTTSSLLNEVRNLSEMVTSFLNFARPQPLQLDEVRLDELIDDCATELAPLFEERKVELAIKEWGVVSAQSRRPPRLGGEPLLDTTHRGDTDSTGNAGAPPASSRVGISPATGNASAPSLTGNAGAPPALRTDTILSNTQPPSPHTLSLPADERMLRQALLNLIRNAAEAIPSGKTERHVEVSISSEQNQGKTWAVVVIKDTGEGIPAADLQRIFIPFFTTKATGHGVGLALAHRVITQHGGTLTAANNPDGGAMFTLRLPA